MNKPDRFDKSKITKGLNDPRRAAHNAENKQNKAENQRKGEKPWEKTSKSGRDNFRGICQ